MNEFAFKGVREQEEKPSLTIPMFAKQPQFHDPLGGFNKEAVLVTLRQRFCTHWSLRSNGSKIPPDIPLSKLTSEQLTKLLNPRSENGKVRLQLSWVARLLLGRWSVTIDKTFGVYEKK